jgi:hypothetical protein
MAGAVMSVLIVSLAVFHLGTAGVTAGLTAAYLLQYSRIRTPLTAALLAWLLGLVWPLVLVALFLSMVRSEMKGTR